MNNNASNNIDALCAQFKNEPKNNTILGSTQEFKKLLIQILKEDAAIKKIRAGDLLWIPKVISNEQAVFSVFTALFSNLYSGIFQPDQEIQRYFQTIWPVFTVNLFPYKVNKGFSIMKDFILPIAIVLIWSHLFILYRIFTGNIVDKRLLVTLLSLGVTLITFGLLVII